MLRDLFSPATTTWFEEAFPGPTEAQAGGWPAIAAGHHTLIHAPTGSGKTLAAFLYTLDQSPHRTGARQVPALPRPLHLADEGPGP